MSMTSLPKLFGKEFLPDPNILLNNYDVFMNDPNMNTFLNGTDPKYNPNPNVNLRYFLPFLSVSTVIAEITLFSIIPGPGNTLKSLPSAL